MSRPAIAVADLSKSYRLGIESRQAGSLREAVTLALTSPLRRFREASEAKADEVDTFWALKGVSFEIQPGEVVGIIGRNGAGKSTLLKILSRIVEPTTGTIHLRGRVASLLEVGTGFHPELTGRENIYLNGSILGMKHAEIARKFDEIVAFAEISKFLDTPVKRYSSGMYVRLAFAVAAHLDPEILIIDEVLAVGDNNFQKKCLSKVQSVSGEGRTVILVSHNMNSVTRICPRAILMDGGRMIMDGSSPSIAAAYLNLGRETMAAREWAADEAPGNDAVRLRAVRVISEDGEVCESIDIRRSVGLEMEFEVTEPGYVLIPNFGIYNEEGLLLFITHETEPTWRGKGRPCGRYACTAWIPGNLLSEGSFAVDVGVSRHAPVELMAFNQAAVAFQVIDSLEGDTARGDFVGHLPGAFRPLLKWTGEFTRVGKAGNHAGVVDVVHAILPEP